MPTRRRRRVAGKTKSLIKKTRALNKDDNEVSDASTSTVNNSSAAAFREPVATDAESVATDAESATTNAALGESKEDAPSSPSHENAMSLPRPSYVPEKAWQHLSIIMRQELVDGVEKCLSSALEKKRNETVVDDIGVCYGDIVIVKRGFSLQSDSDTSNSDASERVLCTKQGGVLEDSLHVLPCINVDPDELTVINECLFRVLPQLKYEFDSASHASDLELSTEAKLAAAAENHAQEKMDRIEDWRGKTVKFCHVVQLQHVLSGKFVSLQPHSVVPQHPSMLKIVLAEGSANAWIKLKPRDFARRAGDELDSMYNAILEFTSQGVDGAVHSIDGKLGYRLRKKNNSTSANSLYQPSWLLSTYSSYEDEAVGGSLKYGQLFTIDCPELGRYLSIVTESELIVKGDDLSDAEQQVAGVAQRLDHSHKHVALVKKADTTAVEKQSLIECLWTLEHENPERGGVVWWSKGNTEDAEKKMTDHEKMAGKVRLRHLLSNDYLRIDAQNKAVATPHRSEATVLCICPISSQTGLNLDEDDASDLIVSNDFDRKRLGRAADAVPADSLVYLLNGEQNICGGDKWSKQHDVIGGYRSEAGPFTLKECSEICGSCWSEIVCTTLQKIIKESNAKISSAQLRWVAQRFGFSHKLDDMNETKAPLNVSQATGRLSAAFRIAQLSGERAESMRVCQELMRRLLSLRATVRQGTHMERFESAKLGVLHRNSGDEEKTSNEQRARLHTLPLRILNQEVVKTTTALVYYAVELPPSTLARIMGTANFQVILEMLIELEDSPQLRTVEHRQSSLKKMEAFEVLFDLLAIYVLAYSAERILDKYTRERENFKSPRAKKKKRKKHRAARHFPDPRRFISSLKKQIDIGSNYRIDSKCPAMQDAMSVMKYLEHIAAGNPIPPPAINRFHYRGVCKLLYSFIRILCKSNSATSHYCSRYSHIILAHFSLDVGAPETFAVVVDNNLELLQKHVTREHISEYIRPMRRGRRLQPKRLEQLQRFCSYGSTPISRVQVLISKLCFEQARTQGDIFLHTIKHENERTGWTDTQRQNYLEKINIFHTSATSTHIIENGPLALYVVRQNKKIRLSRLFAETEMSKTAKLKADAEKDQTNDYCEYYNYYCEQLKLFSCIANGRNYVAIDHLKRLLPFDVVLSGMIDESLGPRLRALFTQIMNSIYVNVEPFFKMHLPVLTRACGLEGTPRFSVADEYFQNSESKEQFAKSTTEVPSEENFAMLQAFVLIMLETGIFQEPKPDHADELTCQAMSLGSYLAEFGFFTPEHFDTLHQAVVMHLKAQAKAKFGTNIWSRKHHNLSASLHLISAANIRVGRAKIHPVVGTKNPESKLDQHALSQHEAEDMVFEQISVLIKQPDGIFEIMRLITMNRFYFWAMIVVLVLSVLLGCFRGAVLLYLHNAGLDAITKDSLSSLFWSFDLQWTNTHFDPGQTRSLLRTRYMPVSMTFGLPLLLVLFADTIMHMCIKRRESLEPEGQAVDAHTETSYDSLLNVRPQKSKYTMVWVSELASTAVDIVEVFVLLMISHILLYELPMTLTALLVLAPVLRCVRFVRLYRDYKQGRAQHRTHSLAQQTEAVKIPEKLRRYFHRDSLANHLASSNTKTLQTQPESNRIRETNPHVTLSIRLQLRILSRLALLEQEKSMDYFGEKFSERDDLDIDDILSEAEISKDEDPTECLLTLCLYPDSEVVSRSVDLLMRITRVTLNLFDIGKRIYIIPPETNFRHRKLIKTLKKINGLTEAFERWGDLSDPQCEANFATMTSYLCELVRVLTNHKPPPLHLQDTSPQKLSPAERIEAARNQRILHTGPSSITELRKLKVERSIKTTILNNNGVGIVREILGLVYEWYGNYSMVGDVAQMFTKGRGINPSIGKHLMTEMLEALNQVLFCVIYQHKPAQKAFLPLVKLLLPLLGHVEGCVDVIHAILDDPQVATQLSNQDIATMVDMLRMSAPATLLRKIADGVPDTLDLKSKLFDRKMNRLEEQLEKKHQHVATLITDVIMRILLKGSKLIRQNQRRVLDAFLKETLPPAAGAAPGSGKHRLELEVTMGHVQDQEYRVAMEHSDWMTSPLLAYHLSIVKILATCCTSEMGLHNVCEVKCQSVIDCASLIDAASQDFVSYQVKTYLLMLFYHAAADVKSRVPFLCNSPAMTKLFCMFGDIFQKCNKMLSARTRQWFENFLQHRLQSKGPLSFLCLKDCKTFFRNVKGEKKPHLQDGNLFTFTFMVVCPILSKLFELYHKEIQTYVLYSEPSKTAKQSPRSRRISPISKRTPRNHSNLKRLNSTAKTRLGFLSDSAFMAPALDFVVTAKELISTSDSNTEHFRAVGRMMTQLQDLLVPATQTGMLDTYRTPNIRSTRSFIMWEVPSQEGRDSEWNKDMFEKLTQTFRNKLKEANNHEKAEKRIYDETAAVVKKLTEENGNVNLLKYSGIVFSMMQQVVSCVRQESYKGYSSSISHKHEVVVAITILRFMIKIFRYVRDRAEEAHPDIKKHQQTLKSVESKYLKQEAKQSLRLARYSASYKKNTINGIPQAINLGVAEFIIILVRKGLPHEARINAMDLFYKLTKWFPADRQQLQGKFADALNSTSYNMNSCYFFIGVLDFFKRAKRRIKYRCEAQFDVKTGDDPFLEEICMTLKFLQCMCEGHFLPLQEQLAYQPQSRHSVNILEKALNLLRRLFKSYRKAHMTLSETQKLALHVCNFLTETVQGPCPRNQDWLLSTDMLQLWNKLLHRMHTDVRDAGGVNQADQNNALAIMDELEIAICDLVMALVEGSNDEAKLEHVLDQIKPTLRHFFETNHLWAAACSNNRDSGRGERTTKFIVLLRTLTNTYTCSKKAQRWLMEITSKPPDNSPCTPEKLRVWLGLPDYFYGPRAHKGNKAAASSDIDITPLVESVEICWNIDDDDSEPRLIPVYFPSPKSFDWIRPSRLEKIVEELEVGDQSRKLHKLIQHFGDLLQELRHVKWLHTNRWKCVTKHCGKRIDLLSNIFVVVCGLVNIFMLFSLVRAESGFGLRSGFTESFPRPENIATHYQFNSLHLLSRTPYGRKLMQHPGDLVTASTTVYWTLKALLVILSCMKFLQYLFVELVPAYEREQRNVLNLLKYHLSPYIAEFVLVIGSYHPSFIALHAFLLIKEFVKRSTTAQIVRAAVFGRRGDGGSSTFLSTTLIILLLICMLFATIVFQFLPKDFPDENEVCASYWSCMVLLINVGLRNGGGMGESMTMYTEEEHFQRWGTSFILNFAAFFIVNMVLLNVVFGIIIDTFGERRDTRTEFELDRDTQCTVCGHGIKDFQKLGKGMFKRVHVKNEHNRWSYFKYWLYLLEKDPKEFNGLEQYVWDLLRSRNINDNIMWMPLQRSLRLENQEKRYISSTACEVTDDDSLMKIAKGKYYSSEAKQKMIQVEILR